MIDNLVLNILAFHIRSKEVSFSQVNVLILRSYKLLRFSPKMPESLVSFSYGIAAE